MSVLDHLPALEGALAAKGFPALSHFWLATLGRVYAEARRQLVLRVGRRGGKSSSLCRVAVLEALFGGHVIPPGDVGVVAIVSVSRDEAFQRLRTIRAILDALGVAYRPIEGGIELAGRPVAFKVYSASVGGVSGFTCICAICDEVAKWRDSDTGANPAKEVLASLRATMATQPTAKIFLSSSPLGMDDAHAVAFDEGENEFQCVAYAPTWEANPSVTEEDTRRLERDHRVWLREYKAEPQAGIVDALNPDDIARAIGKASGIVRGLVGIIDAASGGADNFTAAILGTSEDGLVVFRDILTISPAQLRAWTMAGTVERIAKRWRAIGVTSAYGDQREALSLESLFWAHGVRFISVPWTGANKPQAVATLRRWLADDLLALPSYEPLRRELLAFEEKILPSGQFTYSARRSGHDDHVALLLTGALAATLHGVLGSQQRQEQHERRLLMLQANLALTASRYGFESPVDVRGMSPERREEVLGQVAAGSANPYDTLWTRVWRANEAERIANEATKKAQGEAL